LLKLQNQVTGIPDEDNEEEQVPGFKYVGSGHLPLSKCPAIPKRPAEDAGSADKDNVDEKLQVVVLKKEKHLTGHDMDEVVSLRLT
jgi:hypothetical protein